jgi:hypothetical protein
MVIKCPIYLNYEIKIIKEFCLFFELFIMFIITIHWTANLMNWTAIIVIIYNIYLGILRKKLLYYFKFSSKYGNGI